MRRACASDRSLRTGGALTTWQCVRRKCVPRPTTALPGRRAGLVRDGAGDPYPTSTLNPCTETVSCGGCGHPWDGQRLSVCGPGWMSRRSVTPVNDRLVWIDCEMTGLDTDADALIEVAALVTDFELQVLGDGVDIVIKPPADAIEQMADVVRTMHTHSGLLDELADGVDLATAERQVLDYVDLLVRCISWNGIRSPRARSRPCARRADGQRARRRRRPAVRR